MRALSCRGFKDDLENALDDFVGKMNMVTNDDAMSRFRIRIRSLVLSDDIVGIIHGTVHACRPRRRGRTRARHRAVAHCRHHGAHGECDASCTPRDTYVQKRD